MGVSLIAFSCLSCDQLGAPSASSSPTVSAIPALNWIEVGSASGPAFLNGWTNYGDGYQNCAYAIDAQSQLHIVGILTDTTNTGGSGEIAFQLPVSFRPRIIQREGITSMATGFALSSLGTIAITPEGNVYIYPANSTSDDIIDLGHVVVRLY